MVAAALLTYVLDTARESFELLLTIGAGTGLLYLLRWFWWRVNAWSEVAAMVGSFAVSIGLFIARKNGLELAGHHALLITVGATTVIWIAATFLAPATDRATLVSFYKLVRPAGPGWRDVRAEAGVSAAPDSLAHALLGWILGIVAVYSLLFGMGSFLYGRSTAALVFAITFTASAAGLVVLLPRLWRGTSRA
jgi:hypothetical protein